jgi:two-component system sensor histidine kinase QseC
MLSSAYSLRRRLWISALIVNIAFWVLAASVIMWTSWRITNHMINEALHETGMLILVASRDFRERGLLPDEISEMMTLPQSSPDAPRRIGRNHIQYQIVIGGHVINKTPLAPDTPFVDDFDFTRGYVTKTINGRSWRIFIVQSDSGNIEVQVGRPIWPYVRFLGGIGSRMAPFALILLVIFGAINRGITHKLMKPLESLTSSVTQKTSHDLSPVSVERLPSELAPLVESLNALLARLSRALEAERRFTADAAHELRTPLSALKMKAQLLKRQHPEAAQAFDAFTEDISRSVGLIEQLLLLARLDPMNPGQTLSLAETDVRELVDAALSDRRTAAALRQIVLSASVPDGLTANLNADLVKIALRNLVGNAIKYIDEGGHVETSAAKENGALVLKVADDGPGVSPEYYEQLTHRFFRVLGTGKTGSGLGLSIVARVVELHGGTLTFGKGIDGKGFGATMTLPLTEPETTKDSA